MPLINKRTLVGNLYLKDGYVSSGKVSSRRILTGYDQKGQANGDCHN
jgi:hypothetical protein